MSDKWTPSHVSAMAIRGLGGPIITKSVLVIQAVAHPPGTHPHSPIKDTLTAVELRTDRNGSRWYGCKSAYIDSYLRMRVVGWDTRNEEMARWPDAKEERSPSKKES